jgi:hypothetical protein
MSKNSSITWPEERGLFELLDYNKEVSTLAEVEQQRWESEETRLRSSLFSAVTSIAITIAVASYGTGAKTPLDTILWRDMLPHLVKATLPEIRGGKYRYHVYIAS